MHRIHPLTAFRFAALWLALATGSVAPAPAAAQGSGALAYSRSADEVVIEFRESLSELRAYGAGPTLRVYGDGRIDVLRPDYMKRPGRYEARLTPAELDALVGRLVDRGVLDFDTATLARPKPAPGHVLPPETSDESTVELVVRAARVPAGAALASPPPATPPLRVRGLRDAARARPDEPAIADLADACAELRGMIDADGLEPRP